MLLFILLFSCCFNYIFFLSYLICWLILTSNLEKWIIWLFLMFLSHFVKYGYLLLLLFVLFIFRARKVLIILSWCSLICPAPNLNFLRSMKWWKWLKRWIFSLFILTMEIYKKFANHFFIFTTNIFFALLIVNIGKFVMVLQLAKPVTKWDPIPSQAVHYSQIHSD